MQNKQSCGPIGDQNLKTKQKNPKRHQHCTESGRPGGGDRDTPLEPGMALVEVLYFFLLGCIAHLPLHSIPHLRQRVLIDREVPAAFPINLVILLIMVMIKTLSSS